MSDLIKELDKILIKKTKIKDLDFVIELENAPENRDNVFQWSKEKHIEAINDEDILHVIIEDKKNKKIGYAIVAGLQSDNKSIEIRRVVIDKKNEGYGSEFLKLMKIYTFEDLKYHKLWLDFFATNKKVEFLYKRQGFKKDGVLRDRYYNNNRYTSIVVMSILDKEYFA